MCSGELGLGILIRDSRDISIFIDFFFPKEWKHLNFTNLATVGISQKQKGAELPGTAARTWVLAASICPFHPSESFPELLWLCKYFTILLETQLAQKGNGGKKMELTEWHVLWTEAGEAGGSSVVGCATHLGVPVSYLRGEVLLLIHLYEPNLGLLDFFLKLKCNSVHSTA